MHCAAKTPKAFDVPVSVPRRTSAVRTPSWFTTASETVTAGTSSAPDLACGSASAASAALATRSMPQIGHSPGSELTTCGCIGHT